MPAVVFYQADTGVIDGIGDMPEQEAIRTKRPYLIVDAPDASYAIKYRVEDGKLVPAQGGQG
ncbi:hypothetical protein [Sphingomonas sp. GC_Shp_3]|uniref:hypothetical protein n=1 Tax=Sphingomonas sp. GC_Shp_3 TaxID=2937383 RepID=UPI00226A1FFE|nr:hypothetical protein [Sphingomonas sp. GC_Shp_3]